MKSFLFVLMLCTGTVWAQQTPAQINREVIPNTAGALTLYADGTYNTEQRDSNGVLLFLYRYTAAQHEGIADDEYTEHIGFTIVPDKTGKFKLSGKQLEAAQAYLYKGCFCADRGTFPIRSGSIKGTRMSKTEWYINLNIKVETGRDGHKQTVTKKIKGLYTLTPGN